MAHRITQEKEHRPPKGPGTKGRAKGKVTAQNQARRDTSVDAVVMVAVELLGPGCCLHQNQGSFSKTWHSSAGSLRGDRSPYRAQLARVGPAR